jgi:hypothetical protein
VAKITAEQVERDHETYDLDDRKRCVCLHGSMFGPVEQMDQCLNLTRHPSGKCGDCRYSMRTVDGGALTS